MGEKCEFCRRFLLFFHKSRKLEEVDVVLLDADDDLIAAETDVFLRALDRLCALVLIESSDAESGESGVAKPDLELTRILASYDKERRTSLVCRGKAVYLAPGISERLDRAANGEKPAKGVERRARRGEGGFSAVRGIKRVTLAKGARVAIEHHLDVAPLRGNEGSREVCGISAIRTALRPLDIESCDTTRSALESRAVEQISRILRVKGDLLGSVCVAVPAEEVERSSRCLLVGEESLGVCRRRLIQIGSVKAIEPRESERAEAADLDTREALLQRLCRR